MAPDRFELWWSFVGHGRERIARPHLVTFSAQRDGAWLAYIGQALFGMDATPERAADRLVSRLAAFGHTSICRTPLTAPVEPPPAPLPAPPPDALDDEREFDHV